MQQPHVLDVAIFTAKSDSDCQFSADVKRAVALGTYISLWGMPATRRIVTGADSCVEVYLFPASGQTGGVHRLATVSLSPDGQDEMEFLFAWMPTDSETEGGMPADLEAYEDLVLDAAVHCQERGGAEPGLVIAPSRRPEAMAPTCLLLDEPLTEDETLAQLHLDNQHLPVYWLVPLFEDEVALVAEEGPEAFDAVRQASTQNLFQMHRASMLV